MIGAVILAAGAARRFGADKRLQPFGSSTVAVTTISKYCEIFDAVRLVVRKKDDPILHLVQELAQQLPQDFPLETIVAEDAHLGMGHSLSAGFQCLTWSYAFVALADMPLIQADTLRALKALAMTQGSQIIRPRHSRGGFGHPIGFPADLFTEVERCTGDQGARQLLRDHANSILECQIEDEGLLADIDTPAALEAAVTASKASVRPND
ncbi:MAG: NTP transferase domain-containing protein [Pseudomonadales bacterium]|nr:NTP transferase domain-containing protein [Pseudomonadales bacterium]